MEKRKLLIEIRLASTIFNNLCTFNCESLISLSMRGFLRRLKLGMWIFSFWRISSMLIFVLEKLLRNANWRLHVKADITRLSQHKVWTKFVQLDLRIENVRIPDPSFLLMLQWTLLIYLAHKLELYVVYWLY